MVSVKRNKLMNKAYLTAIKRNKVSAPMKFLFQAGLLPMDKDVLDYGCGRGFDADFFSLAKFDPHFFPAVPSGNRDCVVCNYVLNVVDEKSATEILRKIQGLLSENGIAYVTVRRDVKKEGLTSKGTFQRNVILDLPIVKEKRGLFCIYRLEKNSAI